MPGAITPEVLAQLGYAEIRLPTTEVGLAPEDATKVNLPTWAWRVREREHWWTGTGVAGEQPLPEGDFGGEQDVVVREISRGIRTSGEEAQWMREESPPGTAS